MGIGYQADLQEAVKERLKRRVVIAMILIVSAFELEKYQKFRNESTILQVTLQKISKSQESGDRCLLHEEKTKEINTTKDIWKCHLYNYHKIL